MAEPILMGLILLMLRQFWKAIPSEFKWYELKSDTCFTNESEDERE